MFNNIYILLLQIIQAVKSQLASLEMVGQILDFLNLSIKILFVKNASTDSVTLLTDIFVMLPAAWESDPVKVMTTNGVETKINYLHLRLGANGNYFLITNNN